jgi:Pyruvate/2-oxoacid:ferredoxin oxidoreductase delta subunit
MMKKLFNYFKKSKTKQCCSLCKEKFIDKKPARLKVKTLDGYLDMTLCKSCEDFFKKEYMGNFHGKD